VLLRQGKIGPSPWLSVVENKDNSLFGLIKSLSKNPKQIRQNKIAKY
jgi:hypothetical protein